MSDIAPNTSATNDAVHSAGSHQTNKRPRTNAASPRSKGKLPKKSAKPKQDQSPKKPRLASQTKQDLVLGMLQHRSGASIEEIVAKTKWQPHSVHGFLSGVVRKKLKLTLVSAVGKDSVRRYHIEARSSKA